MPCLVPVCVLARHDADAMAEDREEAKTERYERSLERMEEQREREERKKWRKQSRRDEDFKGRIEILNWLSPGSFSVMHAALQAKHVPKTGSWFLEDDTFKAWTLSTVSPLLLCHGIPGSGKSMLGSIVIEHLSLHGQENVAVLYLYFDYIDHQNNTPRHILRSLLKYVVSQLDIPPHVVQIYEYSASRT